MGNRYAVARMPLPASMTPAKDTLRQLPAREETKLQANADSGSADDGTFASKQPPPMNQLNEMSVAEESKEALDLIDNLASMPAVVPDPTSFLDDILNGSTNQTEELGNQGNE